MLWSTDRKPGEPGDRGMVAGEKGIFSAPGPGVFVSVAEPVRD